MLTSFTSATTPLAPLRPPMVLVATMVSFSLAPQLRPSASLKTIILPTSSPQGLVLITESGVATPAP